LEIENKIGSYSPFKYVSNIPDLDTIPRYIAISKKINLKLSRDAPECRFKFNVINNHLSKYSTYRPLYWKKVDLPINCNVGSIKNLDKDRRLKYAVRLPLFYTGKLPINDSVVELLGKNKEIFYCFLPSKNLTHCILFLLKLGMNVIMIFPN
jgi:hypothetical protein